MLPVGALVRDRYFPERGPLRVIGAQSDLCTLRCVWEPNVQQQVRIKQGSFSRLRLHAGAQVVCDKGIGIVLAPHEAKTDRPNGAHLFQYVIRLGDDELLISEADVAPLQVATSSPLELIKAAQWRGPQRFFRRWRILNLLSRWQEDSGGLPTLLGARIRPLPHQIYAIRRILWDREPRFILADEVGLGKTIEAAVVLHSITSMERNARVLIVAPGSMTRQWQCELYSRFGGEVYSHVDAASLAR